MAITSDFSASPLSGTVPLSVNFIDLSSGFLFNSWQWSFGDTTRATTQNSSHIYSDASSFTVTLENQMNWRDVALSDNGQYQTGTVEDSSFSDGQVWGSSDFGATWDLRQTIAGKLLGNIRMSSDGSTQVMNLLNTNYLYMSADFGITWNPIISAGSYNFFDIAISSTGQYITAAASAQFAHVSSDYGATWVLTGTANIGTSVAMSASGQYQTIAPGVGSISISSDFGQTWTVRPYSHNYTRLAVSSSGQYQVAVTGYDGAGDIIYLSNDYGFTWTAATGYGSISDPGWIGVAISNDGQHILAAEEFLWVSYDFGVSWTKKLPDSARNWTGVAIQSIVPGLKTELACINNGSLYQSLDTGNTWILTDTFSKTRTNYIQALAAPTTTTTAAPMTMDRFWVAQAENNFDSNNWAYVSGGSPSAPIPNSLNPIIFDGQGNSTCILNISVQTPLLKTTSDYTKSLIQQANLSTGDASFLGGSFSGSPAFINQNLVLSGNFFWQGDIYALGDVYCSPGFGTLLTDGTLSFKGTNNQGLHCDGGLLPHTYIDKSSSNQIKAYGDYPITLYGDLLIQDGTFNTHGHDIVQVQV